MMKKTIGPANRPISFLHLSNFSSDGERLSLKMLFPFLFNLCPNKLAGKKGYNANRNDHIAETKKPSQHNV